MMNDRFYAAALAGIIWLAAATSSMAQPAADPPLDLDNLLAVVRQREAGIAQWQGYAATLTVSDGVQTETMQLYARRKPNLMLRVSYADGRAGIYDSRDPQHMRGKSRLGGWHYLPLKNRWSGTHTINEADLLHLVDTLLAIAQKYQAARLPVQRHGAAWRVTNAAEQWDVDVTFNPFPTKLVVYSHGQLRQSVEYRDLRINPTLPDSLFRW